jgi:CRP-like cAMP-binding protein
MGEASEIRVRWTNSNSVHSTAAQNPLSLKEQEQLRRISKPMSCKPGTILYSQGAQAKFVYLVAQGIVRINRCDESGHRQVLVFRVAGDFCGIPHEGIYFNTAEAVCETAVYRLEWREMEELFRAEPHLQSVLLGKILYDYRQAQTRIAILGQQNISQRLATFLLDLIHIPEFFDSESCCLSLPVSRFDLADYLGTAPETIARAFAKLENLALLRRITARSIVILDVAGLRSLHSNPRRGPDTAKTSFLRCLEPALRTDCEIAVAGK